jgi:hypothetical protein
VENSAFSVESPGENMGKSESTWGKFMSLAITCAEVYHFPTTFPQAICHETLVFIDFS